MRRLAVLFLAFCSPAAALAQGACWIVPGEFTDTQPGVGEVPGYIVSVEGNEERCWGNVRLLTAPGQAFADRTTSFYSDQLEPLMVLPDTVRAFGCPYGVGDQVDMLAYGPEWSSVEQTGETWVPAEIAEAEQSCRYDVVAYAGGQPVIFNPLHDQLRPALLARLTPEQIADQATDVAAATTCAPGGTVEAYSGNDLAGRAQRGAVAEILKAFSNASVYLDQPTIGVPANATPGSVFELHYPMAMPDTEVYPVKLDALVCTPGSPRKSEQRWAFEFVCYADRFDTFVCENKGGTLVN